MTLKHDKPLVTFALFTFKQEQYILEALRAALAQTYSPLQILVSDDCSPDRTFDIIKEEVKRYGGSHQIQINRNETNLGLGAHVNKIMKMAQGELIIAAAGDDISLPERTQEIVDLWLRSDKSLGSICSSATVINSKGEPQSVLSGVTKLKVEEVFNSSDRWIIGCSHAWSRLLFERFGPLRDDVISEDKAIAFRSLLIGGGVGYIDNPLVKYRIHSESITAGYSSLMKGRQKILTIKSYLDDLHKIIDKSGHVAFMADNLDLKLKYLELRQESMEASIAKAIIGVFSKKGGLSLLERLSLLRLNIRGKLRHGVLNKFIVMRNRIRLGS